MTDRVLPESMYFSSIDAFGAFLDTIENTEQLSELVEKSLIPELYTPHLNLQDGYVKQAIVLVVSHPFVDDEILHTLITDTNLCKHFSATTIAGGVMMQLFINSKKVNNETLFHILTQNASPFLVAKIFKKSQFASDETILVRLVTHKKSLISEWAKKLLMRHPTYAAWPSEWLEGQFGVSFDYPYLNRGV